MTYTVLIVTPFYYEPPRQKMLAVEIAKSMSRQARVVVISSRVEGAKAVEQSENLTIYRFRPWLYWPSIPYVVDPLLWYKIAHVTRHEKADVILAMARQFPGSLMAAIVKNALRTPFVLWILIDQATFGNPVLDLIPRFYDWTLSRFIVHQADLVLCQTELLRRRARALGSPDKKIRIVPNGVDTNRFRPGLDVSALRRELGIQQEDQVVLFVGNLFPRKGVLYLLGAAPAILEKHPNVRFVLTGTGPQEQELKARAREIAPERFQFVGFRKDIPELLNLATLLVLPSITEGFPQTILEAYSCGVPVVATDVGGVKDVLKSGENGLLVPSANSAALAEAINHLLDDRALRKHIGARNRDTAVRLYSLDRVAEQLLREIQSLSSVSR